MLFSLVSIFINFLKNLFFCTHNRLYISVPQEAHLTISTLSSFCLILEICISISLYTTVSYFVKPSSFFWLKYEFEPNTFKTRIFIRGNFIIILDLEIHIVT